MIRPPERDGPFGPIARVDFDPPKGCGGGSHGYTLDVPGFETRPSLPGHDNPELLQAGEELELWVWRLQVWRSCRFQWLGTAEPTLEVDVHYAGPHGFKVGETTKQLDPRDLFRVTSGGSGSDIPPDAQRAIEILRAAPGSSTARVSYLLKMPIGRTRAALKYLREHTIADVTRGGQSNRAFHYTLHPKAWR